MRQIIIPLVSYEAWLREFIKNPFDCVVNTQPPAGKIVVGLSKTSNFNKDALSEFKNVIPTTISHTGGTLVIFEDGITLSYLTKNGVKPQAQKVVDFLESRSINVARDGNDILCDGFKVGSESFGSFLDGRINFYGLFVTINADPNVVNKLCTKEMRKVPKGLSDYGITRKEILDVLGLSE